MTTTLFRSRLRLESLDERIVPDSASVWPGGTVIPPAQASPASGPVGLPGGTVIPPAQPTSQSSTPDGRTTLEYRPGIDDQGVQDDPTLLNRDDPNDPQPSLQEQLLVVPAGVTPPAKPPTPVVPAPNPFGSEGRPVPGSMTQGGLGDCWFLSALESLTRTNPDAVRGMITTNPDGTYTVKFYGKDPVTVVYDPTIGTTVDGNGNVVQVPGVIANGPWARIIEQAAAQIAGPVGQQIANGASSKKAMDLLFGANQTTYWTRSQRIDAWESELIRRVDNNGNMTKPFTAAPSPRPGDPANAEKRNGVFLNHNYTVVNYNPVTKIVTLRNPHGNRGGNFDNAQRSDDDGTFTMTLQEFYDNFDTIYFKK